MFKRNNSQNNKDAISQISRLTKINLEATQDTLSDKARTHSCLGGKKFIKREMDFGNPRYAASRKSSFCGGLINGRHTLDGFYPLSNIGEKDAEKESEESFE